ncbi:MAG: molybdopterin converting factor subunit 1 [Polynucleobacter sp.]|jgi:molybdopterin synthase sulfur carrier subunit|uniref:molybdopterin converting factor subunit 1 n=1 Tax=unclassified Polynucleobacter TaxID=2640945 RepID=UPI001BFD0EAA|nr:MULTISPECIES: molybdopterin converting factor subunit 1 [unclassified Polynucleobacter]MBU3726586.1 molybdopterin converting factor subunit 1 [Polynucleobacter sp.]NBP19712.1 molybdopterin converting factor subunit 1 [Burkholderiaceae bacterium]NBP96557.1 molybdopterin converting factor subunit 1 [Burkholderiaceae bacterium]NCA08972.1 molybdopterin converting factor subunit 1 [Burkholderiaceae bacterium]NCU93089.1 molybdopterin converting factor subunit 1 [Burkholderiaceae bacterium]
MKLHLRFFASIREGLGVAQEELVIPDSVKTIADLRAFLMMRGSPWADILSKDRVLRCALNQQMVSADTVLLEGAEVAFFPPVTGG